MREQGMANGIAIEIGYGFGLGLVRVIQWEVGAAFNESK